jgi:MFS transporter, OFA family, oxalate/formate antiporter
MQFLGRPLYYGWYVVAAIAGMNFANSATAIGVLTIFVVPLTAEFGWSRTQVSAVTSLGAILGAIAAPFTGRITDRLGARLPLTLGGLLIVIATLHLATMRSLLWFYVAFGLARLADQAFVQAPSPPAVAKWFQRYRGRALAFLFFASSAGGVVMPLLVHLVIEAWHWRTAWFVLGGIMLVVGLLPCAFLVRRQPEDLGVPIDGISAPAPGQNPSSEAAAEPCYDVNTWELREAFGTSSYWLLLAAVFGFGIASTGVGLHLVPHLIQQGLASAAAVGAVSIGSLASAAATFVWGFGAERWSARRLLIMALTVKAVSLAVLLGANTVLAAYSYAMLQGFAEAGLRTMITIVLADYYGRQHLGSIYGVMRSVQVSGFALGPLVSGATFDLVQSYQKAFLSFLLLSIVGMGLVALTQRPLKKSANA